MANPLFFGTGNNPQSGPFGAFGGIMKFMNDFNQFRSCINGDPRQTVQNLRETGQMSDQQFNQLSAMANQIMPFMR